jgi:phosphoketolase
MADVNTLHTVRLTNSNNPLSSEEQRKMHAYWRAANYLSVGQIYLYANPLLREPLKIDHVKPRLLGHWGTTPGLNFIYVHFNRLIKNLDLNVIYQDMAVRGLSQIHISKVATPNFIRTSRKPKKE